MKRLNHIRRHFVRQLTDNDCGIAALAMILNYTGSNAATALRANVTLPEGGFSLLGLRYLANSYGLSARCVQMEIDFLRKNHSPCILHMCI